MNPFYGRFFPELYLHYEYKSETIQRILARQQLMLDKYRSNATKGKKVDPRAFLIMDDCLSSKGEWVADQPIMDIFFNGRHYKLMYILTMQFPLGIKPELRCNFDYIFLLAEDFISNQKRIYEHYAGMFTNFETFKQVFAQITDDFGSMVIVNRGAKKSFVDKVFWFKASNESIPMMGCRQFIKFHEDNFNKNWKNEHKPIDMDNFSLNKRKNEKIFIEKVSNGDNNNKQ